jgi:hypothetical protein
MKGISTNLRTTEHLACLKQAGIDFIARYYSTTTSQPQKRLTSTEAQAISAAGMSIVACYEDGPTQVGYFTRSRGRQDGQNAYNAAVAMLQPKDSAIYFAVDYDAATSDIGGAISDYFHGLTEGFSSAAQGGPPLYAIGVYGSGNCCDWIQNHLSIATYSWLAESTGWGGSNYSRWNIKQSIAQSSLCAFTGGIGGSYENNVSQGSIGDFTVGASDKIVHALNVAAAAHAAAAPVAPPTPFSSDPTGWEATFTMKLQKSSQLLVGALAVNDTNGTAVFSLPATSGLQGHQDKSNLWEVMHGPVPPNPDTKAGNKIETLERHTPTIPREFRITPETVTKTTPPPKVTRGEFRVHHEFGTHGSEGCIAFIAEADFEQFANLMHDLHGHGIESIPLTLKY